MNDEQIDSDFKEIRLDQSVWFVNWEKGLVSIKANGLNPITIESFKKKQINQIYWQLRDVHKMSAETSLHKKQTTYGDSK